MLDRDTMHDILGISEAYQMPEALLSVMLDDERRNTVLDLVASSTDDLNYDGFTTYFQDEHGDRDALKQDFTPKALCDLVAEMAGEHDAYLDACAGTGGLTISIWARNPNAFYRCEEYSARTIPVLLLNMAMRNVRGEVVRKDVLTGEVFAIYGLESGERFSSITQVESMDDMRFPVCVQNPPYSLKWDGMARQWLRYGVPPKSKADYAFVQYGMAHADQTIAILPHGVLFRGSAEGRIREQLLKNGMIRAIVGLPDKLFLHTGIPVCIMDVGKGDGSICVINADELFKKEGKNNVMQPNHVRDVLSCLSMRLDVKRLCHVAGMDEVESNGYNLNIPRYVDRYEEPEIPDIKSTLAELCDLNKQIQKEERSLLNSIKKLVGTTDEAEKEVEQLKSGFEKYVESKGGQMAWKI